LPTGSPGSRGGPRCPDRGHVRAGGEGGRGRFGGVRAGAGRDREVTRSTAEMIGKAAAQPGHKIAEPMSSAGFRVIWSPLQ
jgi:hypothetical protein